MNKDPQADGDTLEVPVSLLLHPVLGQIVLASVPLQERVNEALIQGLSELMQVLGIPGKPVLQLVNADQGRLSGEQPLRLLVNGLVCRYPDILVQRVYCYVLNSRFNADTTCDRILQWLSECASKASAENTHEEREHLIQFLQTLSLELVKRQPFVLLGLPQVRVYAATLADFNTGSETVSEGWPPDATRLLPIFHKVLQSKISLANVDTVARVLLADKERTSEDIAEDLISALSPNIIEVQINYDDLKQMTLHEQGLNTLFPTLRKILFDTLGVKYPEMRFSTTVTLKPASIALKIQHLILLPWANIHLDKMVDLLRCFVTDLEENSFCLLHSKEVQERLQTVASVNSILIQGVQTKFSIGYTTQILRRLVAEEISIRNIEHILERIVNFKYIFTNPNIPIAFENCLPINVQMMTSPVPELCAAFVRLSLVDYFRYKYIVQNSPKMYRVGEKMREVALNRQDTEYDAILRAVRTLIEELSASKKQLLLLTPIDARQPLRDIIATEFPKLPLLAYQELYSSVIQLDDVIELNE